MLNSAVNSFVPLSSSGTAPTEGFPGLQNQTSSAGRPGIHGDHTTGAPGLHTTTYLPGVPTSGVTEPTSLQNITSAGKYESLCGSHLTDDLKSRIYFSFPVIVLQPKLFTEQNVTPFSPLPDSPSDHHKPP